jgi:hypothetical protein
MKSENIITISPTMTDDVREEIKNGIRDVINNHDLMNGILCGAAVSFRTKRFDIFLPPICVVIAPEESKKNDC